MQSVTITHVVQTGDRGANRRRWTSAIKGRSGTGAARRRRCGIRKTARSTSDCLRVGALRIGGRSMGVTPLNDRISGGGSRFRVDTARPLSLYFMSPWTRATLSGSLILSNIYLASAPR